MKYVNPYYLLFDTFPNGQFQTYGREAGYLFNNGGYKALTSTNGETKYYISFEFYVGVGSKTSSLNSWFFCWYCSTSSKRVGIEVNCYSGYLNFSYGDTSYSGTQTYFNYNQWNKLFVTIDTAKNEVKMYLNGVLKQTQTFNLAGESISGIRLYSYYNSNYPNNVYRLRNVIVTDEEIDIKETIVDIPLKVVKSEWKSSDGKFVTTEEGKEIVLETDIQDEYDLTSFNLYFDSAQGGIISNITVKDNAGNSAVTTLPGMAGSVLTNSIQAGDVSRITITSGG